MNETISVLRQRGGIGSQSFVMLKEWSWACFEENVDLDGELI